MREEVFYSKLTEDNKSVKEYTTHRAELLSMYENRDPRMASTVILPYTQFKGWVSNKAKDTEFVMTKKSESATRPMDSYVSTETMNTIHSGNL